MFKCHQNARRPGDQLKSLEASNPRQSIVARIHYGDLGLLVRPGVFPQDRHSFMEIKNEIKS